METFLLHYLELHSHLAYLVIFVGLFLEGEITLFTALFLSYQGYIGLAPVLAIGVVSTFWGDYCWYYLGQRIRRKNNVAGLGSWVRQITKPLSPLFAKYPKRLLLASKFMYGFNRPTLLQLGMINLPAKTFAWTELLVVITWLTVITSLSFIFHSTLSTTTHYLKYAELALAAAVIIFISLEYLIRKIVLRRLNTQGGITD